MMTINCLRHHFIKCFKKNLSTSRAIESSAANLHTVLCVQKQSVTMDESPQATLKIILCLHTIVSDGANIRFDISSLIDSSIRF